jgi:hypothetical protein
VCQIDWEHKGETVDFLPCGVIGFVYRIKYTDGTYYIGSKVALSDRRVKPLKGSRANAVRKKTVETKWRSYNGSSKLVEGLTIEKKEILYFVSTKRSLTYLEAKVLFSVGAVESGLYRNENILGRFFSNCVDGFM